MNKISLKLKITIWFSIILMAVSFSLLFLTVNISQSIIMRDLSNQIVSSVNNIEKNILEKDFKVLSLPGHLFNEKGVQMGLYLPDNTLISGWTPFGLDSEFEFKDGELRLERYNNKEFYIYDKMISPLISDLRVRGVVCVTDELAVIQRMLKYYLFLVIILICLASYGGYLIINKAMEPVTKIRKTASTIAESKDLSQRINLGNGNDEIYSLAKTFDKMLEKLEVQLKKEKQFTSDASHELRTPISVILSECEYGYDCVDDIEGMKEVLESIRTQGNKMSKLVSGLLMISRMDNEKLKLNLEETDIGELLSFICEEQKEIHQDSKVSLIEEIQPNVLCNIDRLLITRVVINILSNAYQYIGSGNEIKVSLVDTKDNVEISIQDNGIGIAPENIDKIWDRFYQVDSSRNMGDSSSGLGLSMVKWIVEKHGGKINVISQLNVGSTFTVVLPKKKEGE